MSKARGSVTRSLTPGQYHININGEPGTQVI